MIVIYLDSEFYSSFNYNLITEDNIKKKISFAKVLYHFQIFLYFLLKMNSLYLHSSQIPYVNKKKLSSSKHPTVQILLRISTSFNLVDSNKF